LRPNRETLHHLGFEVKLEKTIASNFEATLEKIITTSFEAKLEKTVLVVLRPNH
jgi:hypothetical protein